MKCKKCGKENNDEAKFCAYCGTILTSIDSAGIQSKQQLEENDKESLNKKKRKKWIWIMLSILVLIAAVAVAGIFITRRFRERQYDNSIAEGNRYLEEMNYEKAEDSFLQAISVDPKQKEPYLKLIDIYTAQEKYDQVVETAEKAKDAVPAEEQEDFEEVIKVWGNMIDYTWVVEPEIEADDIFYIKDDDSVEYSYNELKRQKSSEYAVIELEGLYGLISSNGEMTVDAEYSNIEDRFGRYLLTRNEAKFEPMMNEDWRWYFFDEETGDIKVAEGFGGGVIMEGLYYYYNGIHNTNENEAYAYMEYEFTDPEAAIPIRQSDRMYESSDSYDGRWPEGLYAVYNDGQLVTDFIYEDCGSESSGLLAVKLDGKWGYVRADGTEVIPAEYDDSWVYDTEDGTVSSCYAASEGYIVLVKDSVWEMRDTDGNLVMPGGVFEEMRPVYDGRCWVKKNGKWGVIEIMEKKQTDRTGEEKDSQTQNEDTEIQKEELLSEIVRSWSNGQSEWAFSYMTTFYDDGTVICEGHRNRDCGTFEIIGENTILATFNENSVQVPGSDYEIVPDYIYSVTYTYNSDDDTLYADYDTTFEEAFMSNASDGVLY